MTIKRHHIIIITLFLGRVGCTHAQPDCSQALIQAERAYYTGRFNEVQTLLAGCLPNGFYKDQKTEAYKLIALSNIFSKNFAHADSALLLMLKSNPQYRFSPQDPPEFIKRVGSFRVHPRIEMTVNLGLVKPFFKVNDIYSTRVLPATVVYKGKAGAHIGLSTAYYLSKKFSIKGGYEWQAYSFTVEDKNDLNTTLLTESQNRSQWLAAAGYNFSLGQIYSKHNISHKGSLQLYGGIIFSKLKKADSYLVLDRASASGEVEFSYSNLPQRTINELRPMIELKLNIPQPNNWMVSLSARYELGLSNVTNASNRNASLARAVVFEWVEDDFKARYLSFSIGLSKLFYRVKLK